MMEKPTRLKKIKIVDSTPTELQKNFRAQTKLSKSVSRNRYGLLSSEIPSHEDGS